MSLSRQAVESPRVVLVPEHLCNRGGPYGSGPDTQQTQRSDRLNYFVKVEDRIVERPGVADVVYEHKRHFAGTGRLGKGDNDGQAARDPESPVDID
jgi:hypothetical protein